MTQSLHALTKRFGILAAAGLLCCGLATIAQADDLELARGNLTMTVPEGWEKVEPRSTIIDAEVKVPAVADDEEDGRLTFMAAGGGVEANIERWRAQFSANADGSAAKSVVKELAVDGQEVYMVDISGTYKSQPRGPRGPSVDVANQRMLAAIVVLDNGIEYFVKLVGPKATVDANAEKFDEMIKGLKAK